MRLEELKNKVLKDANAIDDVKLYFGLKSEGLIVSSKELTIYRILISMITNHVPINVSTLNWVNRSKSQLLLRKLHKLGDKNILAWKRTKRVGDKNLAYEWTATPYFLNVLERKGIIFKTKGKTE